MSAMDIILLEKVPNLGDLGELVTVKGGYGRNLLIPFGKAVPANKSNREAFEARRAELEKLAADKLGQAQQRAAELADIELTLTAKASTEGKLFGSIGARDLAEAITSTGVTVTKSEIQLPGNGPIRTLGEYDIIIRLHSDVTATIRVLVSAES